MRDWGFLPSAEQLETVKAAQKAFRDLWASIRPPFAAGFDGTIEDVRALDYLAYESLTLPVGELEAQALVCGEVLRRAAGLEWVISYRNHWLVACLDEIGPRIAFCPLDRLHEIECRGTPGPGKHLWFLQAAAFECLLRCDPERKPMIREILEAGGEYLEGVELTLEALRTGRSKKESKQGGRRAGVRKRKQ